MEELRAELFALVEGARDRSIPLVTIGAFAVRAYLRRPDRRLTRDLDFVVAGDAVDRMTSLLRDRGYRVYDVHPWKRAERGEGEARQVVDFVPDAVVDVATFDSYPLDPAGARQLAEPGSRPIPVPALEDLLALKLLAHRDKDVLDVFALLREAGERVVVARFRRAVEERDLEVSVRRGYLAAAAAFESGDVARLWQERTGEAIDPEAVAGAVARLHTLVR